MSQFLIEQIRYLHEEIEVIEKAIAELIDEKVKKKKKNILYDYAINYLVDKIQEKSQLLLEYYNDEDKLKKEEMLFLSGKTGEDKNDVWKNYYERVKYIRDYHKKTNIKKIEIKNSKLYKLEALKCSKYKESFSALEKKGKYIDLNKFYNDFINMKKIKEFRISMFKKKEMASSHNKKKKKSTDNNNNNNNNNVSVENINEFKEMDYVTYLHNFTRFSYIPRYCKYRNEEYKSYVENLLNYMITFFEKINVLVDCKITYKEYEDDFYNKFNNKEIKGWEAFTYDLNFYCNINNKLYASEGTYQSYLKCKNYDNDLKKYLNKKYTVEQLQEIKKNIEKEDMNLARCEYLIQLYANILNKIIQRTIQNIQRKQAYTIDEIQKKKFKEEELEDEKKRKKEYHLLSLMDDNNNNLNNQNNLLHDLQNTNLSISMSDDDSSDISNISNNEEQQKDIDEENEDDNDDNKPIYNPLNLPLGFDNKPIPYWLYKLHGLSKEYKCEICGNYSYFGRATFEKHFYEWRHSFGMKCLKIPNTLHFKEITKIEDALNLYEKLKKQTQMNIFKPDQEVECEDSKGNVMNIKAYDDLKRQGLL
ncbi:splicing factor 3A subunit 3, putative [Plasmodium sp. gorilla clade G2]|uniref:splicing factor 3A subunit 3, putative n=1 Tax=Plasmodium sp. gorilla clade G2 TaxID=880535 RepID=UPI000D20E312|nr:splicing factor 3A subunit 3, putative [Plasmodium sp. gorilla clade G2]SOV14381.1 splicing factor 3A subunit 3, putative [Plasmodium sp. gorilla clade G2]